MRIVSIVALALIGCGAATSGAPTSSVPSRRSAARPAAMPTLVLVTIDGAIASDVLDAHNMPALAALAARGVALGGSDAPMVASGPRYISLPGYREILTGRRDGSCRDNECPTIEEPTLLDELRAADAPDPSDVAVIASWETIARAASQAPATLALSAGRHGGAARGALAVSDAARADLDAGARASAFPGHWDYRPDALTARLALDVVAARRPRVLWIALGDADEYAHRGDRAGYLRALAAADAMLGRLVAAVGLDDAIFFVTADHGRAANFRDHGDAPESAAVWLVAAGAGIAPTGFAHTRERHHLADIAPTIRALLRVGADDSPRAGRAIAALASPVELAAVR
jgi:hypothetical protein